MFRLARKTKDSEGHRNVFINPDITKRERLEQFRLLRELRESKLNGEEDLVISNNHIVVRSERISCLRRGQSNFKLTPFFTVRNAHIHVFYLDINKD